MPRVAVKVELNEQQAKELQQTANSHKAEYRLVRRARMILELAEGKMVKDVAAELGERPNTVILWRDRHLANGIEGLQDGQEKRKAKEIWR